MNRTPEAPRSVVKDQPMSGITDEALMAFVEWCRLAARVHVTDPALVRRVFDAYALIPDFDAYALILDLKEVKP